MKDAKGRNRVVVTGIGTVNPVGNNVDEFWNGLIAGKSGIGPVTLCDASDLSCQVAGEVKGFDPLQYLEKKEARHMARFTQFAIAASKMAMENADLDSSKEDQERFGIYLLDALLGKAVEEGDGCVHQVLLP